MPVGSGVRAISSAGGTLFFVGGESDATFFFEPLFLSHMSNHERSQKDHGIKCSGDDCKNLLFKISNG